MMRTTTLVSAALLALLPAADTAAAQTSLHPVGAASWQESSGTRGPSLRHRVLTALAGAALGAGMGYFASQLSRSDWDEAPGVSTVNRARWATVGGGVGLAAGLAFPSLGHHDGPELEPFPEGARTRIGMDELRSVAATNAYDVVRILRPEWLNARPADVFGEVQSQSLPVYLDDFRLGGIEALRGLEIHTIESIRFVTSAVATARWGIGHNNGALQVVTIG